MLSKKFQVKITQIADIESNKQEIYEAWVENRYIVKAVRLIMKCYNGFAKTGKKTAYFGTSDTGKV